MDMHRAVEPEEPRRVPLASLVLGGAPMVPLAAGAVLCWAGPAEWRGLAAHLVAVWAGAVLCFLAGVRRGLSFRTAGGARLGELVTMFGLFVLGVGTLVLPGTVWRLASASLGFAVLGVADARASRVGEAPPFFGAMRPVQAGVAVACLVAALVSVARW